VLLEEKDSKARGVAENYLKVELAGAPASVEAAGSIARARITSVSATCKAKFLAFSQ
jgi:hypothetical protein